MTNSPTYEYDVFISYNRNDEAWAKRLATRLERETWQGKKLRVFFAPWDIKPGESILERLEDALLKSRKVCLVMSPDSGNSEWVRRERTITQHFDITEQQTRLIPLYLRECEIPAFLRDTHRVDFQDVTKFEDGYRVLLATIKDEPLPRGEQETESVKALRASIPRSPVVGFVARRDDKGRDLVERLGEGLAPESNQLIVLSGPGGVGKTTLAAVAARKVADAHGLSVIWISADGRGDFSLSTLLNGFATQLGRPDLRALGPDEKAEQLQSLIATTPILVVLDNFETIALAEQSRCIEFLLHRAPCPALITTRQKITSARNVIVPVMSAEEADDFLQRLIEEVSDPNAFAQVDRGRIMKASERNPLILQWVVAQIDLAQEPNTVLEELAHGVGDAAQRVFDRSFGLEQLGDDSRAALLALSLFAPDASRQALAEAAGFADDIKRLNEAIKRLASLWLLKTAAGGSRLIVEGLARELAKARLGKDARAIPLSRRFMTHFLRHAEAHARTTAEDFDALELEKDNVLGAIEVASALKDWDSVIRIRWALEEFLDLRGHWNEATSSGELAVSAARQAQNDPAIHAISANMAVTHMHRGEYKVAKQIFRQSLAYFEGIGSEIDVARILHNLGVVAYERGDLDAAKHLYQKSMTIKEKLGDTNGIANTWYQKGMVAEDREDLFEAQRCYAESMKTKKKLGEQTNLAIILHNLAVIARHQSDFSKVRELYLESLAINENLGDSLGVAITLHMLGMNAQEYWFLDEARRHYDESLALSRKIGFQLGIALTLGNLAAIAQAEGHSDEVLRYSSESRRIKSDLAKERSRGLTLINVAAERSDDLSSAIRSEARRLELGNRRGIAATLYSLRLIASDPLYQAEAARLLREAVYIFEKLEPRMDDARDKAKASVSKDTN